MSLYGSADCLCLVIGRVMLLYCSTDCSCLVCRVMSLYGSTVYSVYYYSVCSDHWFFFI